MSYETRIDEYFGLSTLQGITFTVHNVEDGDEVVEGLLSCEGCDRQFPINNSIPNLLPQDLRE